MQNGEMKTPFVLLIAGAALTIFGLLWSTCALVSNFNFPVAAYASWNLPAGVALTVVGLVMGARGWVLRRR